MKIATTTGDFKKYCQTDEACIREVHRAGFRNIDLDMYSFTPDCAYMQDTWREEVQKLKAVADELGMRFVQAHSQGGNPLSEDQAEVDFIVAATIRSIEICQMLGIKIPSCITVLRAEFPKRNGLKRTRRFMQNCFSQWKDAV